MKWLQQILRLIPKIWLVDPDESGVRVTLGNRYCPTPPGWYVFWPLIQSIRTLTVTPQVVDLRVQSVFTKDHVDLCLGGGIMYRVDDSIKAILKVQDVDKSLYTLALGVATDYINEHEFKDVSISGIRDAVLKAIREEAAGWGLKIMRMYVTDFGTAKNIRVLGSHVGLIDELEE